MNRRGFALIAVLWVVTLMASLAGIGLAAAKMTHGAAGNRLVLTRGHWAAEACVAIAQARWQAGALVDTATIDLGRTRCAWSIHDPTTRINVNTASREMLGRLFQSTVVAQERVPHLVRAVVRVRDAAPVTDPAQLMVLPDFPPSALPYLTADGPSFVNASGAPSIVLLALPGVTEPAVRVLVGRHEAGRPIRSLDELIAAVSGPSRDSLMAHYAQLAPLLRFARTRVLLVAEGWVTSRGPYPRATVERYVALLPDRLAVLRRRIR